LTIAFYFSIAKQATGIQSIYIPSLAPNSSTSHSHFNRVFSVDDLMGAKEEIFTGLMPEKFRIPYLIEL